MNWLHTCHTSSTGKACKASHNAEIKQNEMKVLSSVAWYMQSAADKRKSINSLNSRSIHLIYILSILFVTSPVLVTDCISSCCRSGWLHLSHVLSCLASIFCLSPTLWLPATHTCLKSVVSSKLPSRAAVMAGLSFDEQFNRYKLLYCQPLQWLNKHHHSPANSVSCVVCPGELT